MEKKTWKILTWIIEIAFLFLALTAPLNPFLTTKVSVFAWCFIMIGLGVIAIIIATFKGYPPEEFSIKE